MVSVNPPAVRATSTTASWLTARVIPDRTEPVEPGELGADFVSSGRQVGDEILPLRARRCRSHDVGFDLPNRDRDPGDDGPLLVANHAANSAGRCLADCQRREPSQKPDNDPRAQTAARTLVRTFSTRMETPSVKLPVNR